MKHNTYIQIICTKHTLNCQSTAFIFLAYLKEFGFFSIAKLLSAQSVDTNIVLLRRCLPFARLSFVLLVCITISEYHEFIVIYSSFIEFFKFPLRSHRQIWQQCQFFPLSVSMSKVYSISASTTRPPMCLSRKMCLILELGYNVRFTYLCLCLCLWCLYVCLCVCVCLCAFSGNVSAYCNT